jgi:PD-(D/E)XK nuclease superfamily
VTIVAERVRQSFAALYDSCPRAALFSISEGEHSTHPQARGSIAHEFKRRVVAECIENGEATYPVEMAKPLMVEVIERSGLSIPAAEFDMLMGLAWKFCETHTFDVTKIVDLEEEYTTDIDGLFLTGRPDLLEIDGRVATVRDYKTGWAIDPETELRGSFQGRWYAKLVLDNYPQIHTVRLVWEYERWTQTREVSITREDLPDIDAMLTTLIARIRHSRLQDDWPASPGKWCSLCPSPQKCPIPSDYRGEGLVTSPESAEAIGELLLSLEAIRALAKASLRAWCDEHGPIEIGGMRFDFKPTADSERVIDKDALRDQMKRAGLKWGDHFKTVKGSTQFKARKAA